MKIFLRVLIIGLVFSGILFGGSLLFLGDVIAGFNSSAYAYIPLEVRGLFLLFFFAISYIFLDSFVN